MPILCAVKGKTFTKCTHKVFVLHSKLLVSNINLPPVALNTENISCAEGNSLMWTSHCCVFPVMMCPAALWRDSRRTEDAYRLWIFKQVPSTPWPQRHWLDCCTVICLWIVAMLLYRPVFHTVNLVCTHNLSLSLSLSHTHVNPVVSYECFILLALDIVV